jgi:hypothetical protein
LSKWTRTALLLVTGVVLAYATFLILDLLVAWSIYGYFFRGLSRYGIPEYIGGILAVWLAAAVVWFWPTVVFSVVTRRKSWIWKVALGVSVWFGVLYVVSYPYSGGLFNPFTGAPRFRYSMTTDGVIRKFPMGFTTDPDFGLPLRDFDPIAAAQYHRQQGKAGTEGSRPTPSSVARAFVVTTRDGNEIGFRELRVTSGDIVLETTSGVVRIPPDLSGVKSVQVWSVYAPAGGAFRSGRLGLKIHFESGRLIEGTSSSEGSLEGQSDLGKMSVPLQNLKAIETKTSGATELINERPTPERTSLDFHRQLTP